MFLSLAWLSLVTPSFLQFTALAGCGGYLENSITHVRKALQLAKSGENRKPEVVGFHGTSVEALAKAMATGRFPNENEDHQGLFFIVPVNKRIPKSKRSQFDGDWETSAAAMSEASDYAARNAFVHAIVDGLKPARRVGRFTDDLRELNHNSTIDDLRLFAQHYQSPVRDLEQFEKVLFLANQRKGIVLGIDVSAYTSMKWKMASSAKDYIQFRTDGFPLAEIRTILPLSEADAQAIEQLLTTVHP